MTSPLESVMVLGWLVDTLRADDTLEALIPGGVGIDRAQGTGFPALVVSHIRQAWDRYHIPADEFQIKAIDNRATYTRVGAIGARVKELLDGVGAIPVTATIEEIEVEVGEIVGAEVRETQLLSGVEEGISYRNVIQTAYVESITDASDEE